MYLRIAHYQHIHDLREDTDLSQAVIAKILDCTQVSYSYCRNQ